MVMVCTAVRRSLVCTGKSFLKRQTARLTQSRCADCVMWLFPLSAMCGILWAYSGFPPGFSLLVEIFAAGLIGLAWGSVRRFPFICAFATGAATFFFMAGFAATVLDRSVEDRPGEPNLRQTYLMEGRLVYQTTGGFGQALVLDRIRVVSPKEAVFALDRLTVYLPPGSQMFPKHSRVRTWLRLKRQTRTKPFPIPIQGLQERWTPRYFGVVKDIRLVETPLRAKRFAPALSEANRELVGLFLLGNPSRIWQDRLRPFGLGHLLAISGLHCLVVFLALQALFFWVRHPMFRTVLTLCGLLSFGHWMGWTHSVQRAVCMLGLWQVLGVSSRPRSWYRIWFFLLLTLLLLEPEGLLFRGFWLTFGASLGLMVGYRRSERSPLVHPWHRVIRPFSPILGAQLMVIPINLMFDGKSDLTSVVWNLVGVVFLMVLLVLFVLCLPGLIHASLAVPANGLEAMLRGCIECLPGEALLGTVVRFPHHPLWVVLVLSAMALFLAQGRPQWRWLLAGSCLFCFCMTHRPLSGARAMLVDVGQGQCLMCCDEAGRGIVCDAGGRLPPNIDLHTLTRLFGARRLEAILISHFNEDHYGLISSLPQSIPVYVPAPQIGLFDRSPLFQNRPISPLIRGQQLRIGTFFVDVLWPPEEPGTASVNETGLVFLLSRADWSIWLAGDSGMEVEGRIDGFGLTAQRVLIVGHHGSRTASGKSFLARFQPQYALISCGGDNPFHHPHPEPLHRLREAGAEILSTGRGGTIHILARVLARDRVHPVFLADPAWNTSQ